MSHKAAGLTSIAAALFAGALFAALADPAPAAAQQTRLDAGTLGQLLQEIDRFRGQDPRDPLRQQGPRTPARATDPRDAIDDRARRDLERQAERLHREAEQLTPEDLEELRRACRQPFEHPLRDSDFGVRFDFSRIEEDYCRRTGEVLFQFGYETFAHEPQLPQMAVGAVSPDYVLGVGDELTVLFTGQENASYILVVDREGRLIIPGWAPVAAAGRSFGELRRELEARTAATRIGTDVYVSLGAVRSAAVYVLGEVRRPGRQQLTALSSIIDAIAAAGGVNKTGSLRRIHVQRGDGIFWFDTYDLLYSGVTMHDLALRDGDRIVVPAIGPTVAVAGDVVRPGIYELAEGRRSLRLQEALDLAGGPLRPRGSRLLQIVFDETGRERLVQQPDLSRPLADGEVLMVARGEDVRTGVVEIAGHVRVPGRRSLAQASTLSRLIGEPTVFQDDAYLLFAALETTDPQTRARRLFPVSLQAVLEGRQDFSLRDNDRLIVLGQQDIAYLGSKTVLEAVVNAGKTEDELLARQQQRQDQLQRPLPQLPATTTAQGQRQVTLQQLQSQQQQQQQQQQQLRQQQEMQTGPLVRPDRFPDLDRRSRNELIAAFPCRGLEQLAAIAATAAGDRFRGLIRTIDIDSALASVAPAFCPKVYDSFPELLPLALEHVMAVTGAVRRPGGYPVTGNTPVTAVIAVAGGLTRSVDLTRVEISRIVPDPLKGIADDSRELIDLATNGADQVAVGPGDIVKFHEVFTDRDSGPVVLEGEFVRPGTYAIRRGERLSEVVRRAGGVTEQAYPYGAVFTRERVKEAQQRDFRRAARELNSALAVAASQRDIDIDSLVTLQLLAAQLASVEALGRVVTEADPTVLQVKPELDVVLEAGDRLFMPKRPSFVSVVGDVLNPGSLQFISGTSADAYIRQAGGFQRSADEDRIFVVYPNGVAEPLSVSVWNYNPIQIPPGSSIVVPKDPAPFDLFRFVREGSSIVSQLAVAAASLAVISRN